MMGKIAEYLEEEQDCVAALTEAKRAKALIEAMKDEKSIEKFSLYVTEIDEQIGRLSEKQS